MAKKAALFNNLQDKNKTHILCGVLSTKDDASYWFHTDGQAGLIVQHTNRLSPCNFVSRKNDYLFFSFQAS